MKAPAETYTSEERFGTEWNSFFQDYPQIIGMSGDLASPNSYLTIDDFGSPILATRDANGKLIKKIGNMQKAVVLYKPLPKLLETLKKSGLGHLVKSVPKASAVKTEKTWYTKLTRGFYD